MAFFGSIVFGIIVGWLYWRTGSIIPGIIIHIVNNSLTAIDTTGWNNTTFIIILVVSLLLLAFGLWWFGKKCITPQSALKSLPGFGDRGR